MLLCLSCRRASPRGATYCGFCGRSYGVRICDKGHVNAPQVRCCTACASPILTEPTRFLRLGAIAPLLAGLAALLLWRWGVAHLPLLAGLLWRGLLLGLALLLDTTPCVIVRGLDRAMAWLFALWFVGWALALLPGRGGGLGSLLRSLPGLVWKASVRIGRPFLRLLGGAVLRAVWKRRQRGEGEDS